MNGALVMAEELIEIFSAIASSPGMSGSLIRIFTRSIRRSGGSTRSRSLPITRRAHHVRPSGPQPVRIADNVWIGMNAVILKGVTIGEKLCRCRGVGGLEKRSAKQRSSPEIQPLW